MVNQAFTTEEFTSALSALSSEDPHASNDACDVLFANAEVIKSKVAVRLSAETNRRIRSVLLEVLGSTGDPTYIPVLERALTSRYDEVAFGAFLGLQRMQHADATRIAQIWLAALQQNLNRRRPPL